MAEIKGPQQQQGINVGEGRDFTGNSKMADRSQSLGAAASLRGAYQADTTGSDAARNSQNTALTYMGRAMAGQEPSAAEIAGRRAIDQSLNNQLGAAASARGGALGQAAAMRQAQLGAGAFQQQAVQTLAANRANEMAQARQDYGGLATAQRGQELQNMAQMSQNELAQRQLNQQAQMGYEQMGNTANFQQAQTDLGVAGINSGNWQSWQNQQQIQAGENARQQAALKAQKDAQEQQMIMGLVGAGASTGAALMTGGGSAVAQAGVAAASQANAGGGGVDPRLQQTRADGGPVDANKPYLVGERGPELVVPRNDGHVIPAEQTQQIVPLMDSSEGMLQATPEGHAYYKPRLEAPPVHPAFAPSPAKPSMGEAAAHRAKAAPAQRQLTPEELMMLADQMKAQMQSEHDTRMAQGPAVLMVRS